jgi:hypothetical protein
MNGNKNVRHEATKTQRKDKIFGSCLSEINGNFYLFRFFLVKVFLISSCLCVGFLFPVLSYAQDQPTTAASPAFKEIDLSAETPSADQPASEGPVTLSKPEALPTESGSALAPSADSKPSQGEGEKAPVESRPTAVPQFSLPEVVITGENELTIEAKRLDRKENDVTLGSHDLTGVDRAFNDLPGLSKTFTALATEEAGPAKDTALVLHLGGGVPDTYGGWGLFGQQFKDVQYLLSGFYSNWGGEATGTGFDGDRRYGYGGQVDLFPSAPMNLLAGGDYQRLDAELPYQDSKRELHDDIDLDGTFHWKLSDLTQAQLKLSNQSTYLTYWDQSMLSHETQEFEAQFKLNADALGSFLNRATVEMGERHATSDFSAPAAKSYDWAWMNLQGFLKQGENLNLTVQLQAQGGSGLDLPLRAYPAVNLMWRAFENSQVNLYWQTDRGVDSFNKTYMSQEHISAGNGFPSPTEVTSEWGGRVTQKLSEAVLLSLTGSTAQIQGYHQWTDINATDPVFIQDYSTLDQVRLNKAAANLQWDFMKDWQAAATYQWTQGLNQSGDGRNLTGLPTSRGIFSLYRGDEKWEARLELQVASERQAYESLPGTLPAYATLGLDATYHLSKTFSLWMAGDNLLGQGYQLQPGYLEPEFHVRGGVEIIF